MRIFNIQIWGEDANKFMALSCDKKKQWIKKHTNQKSDGLIEEFLETVKRGVDGEECQGCKEEKHAKSETISAKDATAPKSANPAKHGSGGNNKGAGHAN